MPGSRALAVNSKSPDGVPRLRKAIGKKINISVAKRFVNEPKAIRVGRGLAFKIHRQTRARQHFLWRFAPNNFALSERMLFDCFAIAIAPKLGTDPFHFSIAFRKS